MRYIIFPPDIYDTGDGFFSRRSRDSTASKRKTSNERGVVFFGPGQQGDSGRADSQSPRDSFKDDGG